MSAVRPKGEGHGWPESNWARAARPQAEDQGWAESNLFCDLLKLSPSSMRPRFYPNHPQSPETAPTLFQGRPRFSAPAHLGVGVDMLARAGRKVVYRSGAGRWPENSYFKA